MAKKGYVVRSEVVLMPTRDAARMARRGWVAATDYVRRTVNIVTEVDEGAMSSRPVGFVTDRRHVKHVVERVGTEYVESNRLVRIRDLMDVKQMSWRTGRKKSTIVGTWLKWPDFPQHVGVWGGSKVWFWPDVVACLERHGVTVRREVADGNSNEEAGAEGGGSEGRDEGADAG